MADSAMNPEIVYKGAGKFAHLSQRICCPDAFQATASCHFVPESNAADVLLHARGAVSGAVSPGKARHSGNLGPAPTPDFPLETDKLTFAGPACA